MSAPRVSSLLDLDALMPAPDLRRGKSATDAVSTIPPYPGENPIPNASTGYHKANSGAASGDGIPTIPVIPAENTGIDDERLTKYQVSPAAVAMILAWSERKSATDETLMRALRSLGNHPPAEQAARWSRACERAGLRPWRVLHTESAGTGEECTGCRHFDSFADHVEGTRRRFHWRCALGYPVFELWRWCGLMLIAPPECASYERHTIPNREA